VVQKRRAAPARQVVRQRLDRGGQFFALGYQAVQGDEMAAFRDGQAAHFPALPPLSTTAPARAAGRVRADKRNNRSSGVSLMAPD
jgi:hypothetical protein